MIVQWLTRLALTLQCVRQKKGATASAANKPHELARREAAGERVWVEEYSTYAPGHGRYFYKSISFKSNHISFGLNAIAVNGFVVFSNIEGWGT